LETEDEECFTPFLDHIQNWDHLYEFPMSDIVLDRLDFTTYADSGTQHPADTFLILRYVDIINWVISGGRQTVREGISLGKAKTITFNWGGLYRDFSDEDELAEIWRSEEMTSEYLQHGYGCEVKPPCFFGLVIEHR
jgi:hypothetical protein